MSAVERFRQWNRSLDEPVDVRAIAVLRIALGPVVILHLVPFLADARQGIIYRDRFTLPFADWYPELPRFAYFGLLCGLVITALLLSIGLWTRAASWATALGVSYNVFLSQTHFHHNRAFLIILLFGIAVLPSGNTVSIDAWRAREKGSPLLPIGGSRLARLVLRIEVATVYLASGFSKLIDGDWWGGTVTHLRVVQHRSELIGLPEPVVDLLTNPSFHTVAAKGIVLTELFIGVGLLLRRTRWVAVWVAIPFHVAIQFSAAVQVFSIAALFALVIWVDAPSGRRVAQLSPRWCRVVAALDWTGRFTLEPAQSVVDVGVRSRRTRAEILSLLPLTFWWALPVRWWQQRQTVGPGH